MADLRFLGGAPEPGRGCSPENDIRSLYSRARALENGLLIDVSAAARRVGLRYPVALSAVLWEEIHTLPRRGTATGQNCLHSLLESTRQACRQCPWGMALLFPVFLPGTLSHPFSVQLQAGPGDHQEPVLTLLRPPSG